MENAPDPDEPLTLEEACKLIFRDTIKPATLRAEARRGRLVIEKIGRKHFVSRRAIQEMREKARADQKVDVPPPPPSRPTPQRDPEASLRAAHLEIKKILEKGKEADRRKRQARLAEMRPKRQD